MKVRAGKFHRMLADETMPENVWISIQCTESCQLLLYFHLGHHSETKNSAERLAGRSHLAFQSYFPEPRTKDRAPAFYITQDSSENPILQAMHLSYLDLASEDRW